MIAWEIARASAFVAFACYTLVVAWGIGLSGRFWKPPAAQLWIPPLPIVARPGRRRHTCAVADARPLRPGLAGVAGRRRPATRRDRRRDGTVADGGAAALVPAQAGALDRSSRMAFAALLRLRRLGAGAGRTASSAAPTRGRRSRSPCSGSRPRWCLRRGVSLGSESAPAPARPGPDRIPVELDPRSHHERETNGDRRRQRRGGIRLRSRPGTPAHGSRWSGRACHVTARRCPSGRS